MSEWGGRKAQQLTALCLATYGDICHLCDRPGADTADHLIARKRGGDDSIDNLRPAHQSCNSVRGDRSVSWARAYIARLRSAPLEDNTAFFGIGSPEAPATPSISSPD